jgi:hypothetical protein
MVKRTNNDLQNTTQKDRQYNGQKDKQWSTKHYTENKRMSTTNPNKKKGVN